MGRRSKDRQPPRALLIGLTALWLTAVIALGFGAFRLLSPVDRSTQAETQGDQQLASLSAQTTAQSTPRPIPSPVQSFWRSLWQRATPTPVDATATATFTVEPTVTPTPTMTPTPPLPEPPFPTPIVDLEDRSIYSLNLRPQYVDDVDAVPDAPHYFIQAMLIPDETPIITGIQRVRYTNQESEPLNEVYFRLYPNLPAYEGSSTVNRVIVDSQLVTPTLEYGNSALRIPLTDPLEPGEVVDMTLWFFVTMPTTVRPGSAGSGLYGFFQGVYDMAAFYPTLAVYDQNGWNLGITQTFGDSTFTDTAYYHVQLTVPTDQQVVASGSTIDRSNNGDGTDTWHIIAGPVRAFYAASSARYQFITDTVDDITVNSYFLDNGLTGATTALNYATGSLAVFNRIFAEYPYQEMDVIAMPTTGFGLEYPGVIAIANRFYGEAGGAYAEAVVHEVAHQWWYNLLGNDQPDEPWLDESLSNYAYYLYFEEIGWTEMANAIMNNDFRYRYQVAQNLGIDRPVAGPVSEFDISNYINIVYSKGPLFFHAVRERMGDEAFFAALRDYADTHRYGIVYAADLMAAFARHTEQPLDDLYTFWIGD